MWDPPPGVRNGNSPIPFAPRRVRVQTLPVTASTFPIRRLIFVTVGLPLASRGTAPEKWLPAEVDGSRRHSGQGMAR